jgi:menaquinone-dependent protoporphyrinogen oxidase
MARVLIPYGTTECQTASISEYITEVLIDHGHEAEMLDIKELPGSFALGDYKAVIVGAPIHMGEYEEDARDFVKRNREALTEMLSAYFSVSLAAQDGTDKARTQTREYVEKFCPGDGLISRHGRYLRRCAAVHTLRVRKALPHEEVTRDKGGADTDSSHACEYTDWNDVSHSAEEFMEVLPVER